MLCAVPPLFPSPRSLVASGALVLAAGCAGYPGRTAAALRDFQEGHLERSLTAYEDPELTGTPFLQGAEAGTVALAMGAWDRARASLDLAVTASEEAGGRGALEPTRLVETLGSFGLNDTTKAYEGEGFERVYLHACLALTYLAIGRLDDVGVEVRRANQILEGEEELYDKKYQAGGFGHLLSALSYELKGELDQAYVDYQRMEEKGLGTELAGRALVRIASQLGREDEVQRWTERYGAPAALPDGAASVVVLAGVGLAPFKVEASLVLPLPGGAFSMAVPGYRERPQPVSGLALTLAGGEGARTTVVESVSSVAQQNLADRLAWVAAKSIGRGLLKRELTKQLEDEYGLGGRVAGDLFSIVSERADLRGWQTLPDSWQAARLFVAPGVHTLALEALGGESVPLGSYELDPGETMVVLARTVGARLYAYPIGGRPLAADGALATGPPAGEAIP